jgi:hypothetical protein
MWHQRYTLRPGGIPGMIDRWSTQIAERIKLSPLAGAWYSELGGLNRVVTRPPLRATRTPPTARFSRITIALLARVMQAA